MTLQAISESTIDTIVSTLRLSFEYHIVKFEYHLYSMHARHKSNIKILTRHKDTTIDN